MGVFINILFFIVSFVTLAIASGFIANSAVRVTQIPSWENNPSLKSAHGKLRTASIVGWITVSLLVVAVVLYLIFGLETAEIPGVLNIITYILLFSSLGATIVVGIFAAIASQEIANAKVSDDQGARKQSIIGTVLAIVGFATVLTIFLLKVFYKPKKKSETPTTSPTSKQIQQLLLLKAAAKGKEKADVRNSSSDKAIRELLDIIKKSKETETTLTPEDISKLKDLKVGS